MKRPVLTEVHGAVLAPDATRAAALLNRMNAKPAAWVEPERTNAELIDDAEHYTGMHGCTHVEIPLPLIKGLLAIALTLPLDELTALRAECAPAPLIEEAA